jgi:hypothetical protein
MQELTLESFILEGRPREYLQPLGGPRTRLCLASAACLAMALGGPASGRAGTPPPPEQASPDAPTEPTVEAADAPDDKGRWAAFPIISSSPETSLMLGGAVLRHFRVPGPVQRLPSGRWPRRSSLAVFAAYSLKNQFALSVAPTLYLQGETWSVGGSMNAVVFPSTFYEIGRESREASAEDFTQRLFAGSLEVSRSLFSFFRAGLQVSVAHARITEVESGGLLDSGGVPGSEGGLIVGLGPTLAWDSRDQNMASRSGALYQITAIGSSYDYGLVSLKAGRYFNVTRDHVLALGASGQLGWGDMPFQVMTKLGGDSRLRGYFDARYTDIHGFVAQAEYRLPLYWKIGGVAFAGLGDVAGELSEFDLLDLKYAGGVGLRYALNAKDGVNLRLDLALTADGDPNLYIAIGEAF